MKRGTKIAVVASVSVCVIGAALFGVGMASGGQEYVRSANLNELSSEKQEKGSGKTQTLSKDNIMLKSFDTVDITCENLDVSVVPSDKDYSYLSYSVEERKGKNPLSYDVANDTLSIREQNGTESGVYASGHVDISFIGWLFGGKVQTTEETHTNLVTLHLAKDAALKESKVYLANGDLDVGGINSKNVDWTLDYGDLDLTDSTLDGGSVILDDGDITMQNTEAHKIQWVNKYGDWDVKRCTMRGGTAELTDGDLTMDDSQWLNGTLDLDYGDWSGKDIVLKSMATTLKDGDVEIKQVEVSGKNSVESAYGDVDIKLTSDMAKSIVNHNSMDSDDETSEHRLSWKDGTALHVACADGDSTIG